MVRDNRYDTAYIFGAICPARAAGAAAIAPAGTRTSHPGAISFSWPILIEIRQ